MEVVQASRHFSGKDMTKNKLRQKLCVRGEREEMQFDDSAKGLHLSRQQLSCDCTTDESLEPPTPAGMQAEGLTSWNRVLPNIRVVGPGYESRVHGSTAALTALKRARSCADISTEAPASCSLPKQLAIAAPRPPPSPLHPLRTTLYHGGDALLAPSLGSSPSLPSPAIPALPADRAARMGKARRLEVQDSVDSVDFMGGGMHRLSLDSMGLPASSRPSSSSSSTPRTHSLDQLPQGCSVVVEPCGPAGSGGAALERSFTVPVSMIPGGGLSGRVHGHSSFSELCQAAVMVGANSFVNAAPGGPGAADAAGPHRKLHCQLGKSNRLVRLDSGPLGGFLALEHP